MILDSKNNYWKGVSLSIKMNTKGGNMEIVYNMVAYKSKVIHVENYTLNSSPIRHNSNAYPR